MRIDRSNRRRNKPKRHFSFSPNHRVAATGRARGSHETSTQDVTVSESESGSIPSSSSPPPTLSSELVATPSPGVKSQKLPSPKTVLKSFLLHHDNDASYANANVIQKHRVHIKHTPKPEGRRFRDAYNIVACGLERLTNDIFDHPKWTKEQKFEMMEPHILKYIKKNKGECFYIQQPDVLYCCAHSNHLTGQFVRKIG